MTDVIEPLEPTTGEGEKVRLIAQDALASEFDARQTFQGIAATTVSTRSDVLRDLGTAGIATIGGVVTLLTVKPELVKTPILLGLGALAVIVAVIFAFIARQRLINYLRNELFFRAERYIRMSAAMQQVIREPLNQTALDKWTELANQTLVNPQLGRFTNNSTAIVSFTLLGGTIAVVVGLLLNISL